MREGNYGRGALYSKVNFSQVGYSPSSSLTSTMPANSGSYIGWCGKRERDGLENEFGLDEKNRWIDGKL